MEEERLAAEIGLAEHVAEIRSEALGRGTPDRTQRTDNPTLSSSTDVFPGYCNASLETAS